MYKFDWFVKVAYATWVYLGRFFWITLIRIWRTQFVGDFSIIFI